MENQISTNVYNLEELNTFLTSLETDKPNVNKWIHSNLRRWLIKNCPRKRMFYKSNMPVWAKKAAIEKQLVQLVLRGKDFKKTKADILNALNYVKTVSNPSRVGVDQAIREEQKKEHLGRILIWSFKDWKAYSLLSLKEIKKQGNYFNNCLKFNAEQAAEQVSRSKRKIFVLTLKNKPCVLMNYDTKSNSLSQIKGPNNLAPSKKHTLGILNFLNFLLFSFDHLFFEKTDLNKAGLVFSQGVLYTEKTVPPEIFFSNNFIKENKIFCYTSKKGKSLAIKSLLSKKPEIAAFHSQHVSANLKVQAYDKLGKRKRDFGTRHLILESPYIPIRILDRAIKSEETHLKVKALISSRATRKHLEIGIRDSNSLVRRAVIRAKNVPPEFIEKGLTDISTLVKLAAVENATCSEQLDISVQDPNPKVRSAVLNSRFLTKEHVEALLRDSDATVRLFAECNLKFVQENENV